MTKETKYTKKETSKTVAKFGDRDLNMFMSGIYAASRREEYLARVAARPANPRLDERGAEILSPISTVADVDMAPLTTRQNMGRFVKMPSHLVGDDGFDSETMTDQEGRPVYDESDMYVPERGQNPPSPHEVRAHNLGKKLTMAKKARQEAADKVREEGNTPTHKDQQPAPDPVPEPKKG